MTRNTKHLGDKGCLNLGQWFSILGLIPQCLIVVVLLAHGTARAGEPSSTMDLLQVRGRHFVDLRLEPGEELEVPPYRLRPGEVFRASHLVSGGYRIIDVDTAERHSKVDSPLFIRAIDARLRAIPSSGIAARLDPEIGETTTLFAWPGESSEDCDTYPDSCKALRAEERLTVIDARFLRTPLDVQVQWHNYYLVRLPNGQKGWVRSEILLLAGAGSRTRVLVYPAPTHQEEKSKITETPETSKQEIDKVVTQLEPEMGKCLISPASQPPRARSSVDAFDAYVGEYWEQHNPSEIVGPNGALEKRQLEAVDALARTIYGEMAICRRDGSHYLAAVAAVIHNRTSFIEAHPEQRKIFAQSPATESRLDLTDVIISPKQFSVWNWHEYNHEWFTIIDPKTNLKRFKSRTSLRPNRSLPQVLCPPSSKFEINWKNRPADDGELEIWTTALKIATEAVLFPKEFARRASSVRSYYYTSGLSEFRKGFKEVEESMDGYALDNPACIQLWENPKGLGVE